MIDIISHLNRAGYDYLNKPVGDGITDDSRIIQARAFASRFNSGISAIPLDGGRFFIGKTIKLDGNIKITG